MTSLKLAIKFSTAEQNFKLYTTQQRGDFMRKSGLLVTVIVLIVIAVGAIVLVHRSHNNTSSPSVNNPSVSSSSSQSASGTINIRDMMFTPSQITVSKGGTVTWTNNDTTTHTVVDDLSNVDGPHSGDIPPGGSYSFTFNKAGSFQY